MTYYDPRIHNRRSIRLKNYDYSKAGLYFVTICCQDMACLFGGVVNGEMVLNDAGRMIETWYHEIENKYPDKRCHEMVVMPNHFHCIIENLEPSDNNVLNNIYTDAHVMDAHVGTSLRGRPLRGRNNNDPSKYGIENKQYQTSLGNAVGWFKTMTTNEYIRGVKNLGWTRFNGKLWQRNYYEHIIRDQQAYENISKYIQNNPVKWVDDKFYLK